MSVGTSHSISTWHVLFYGDSGTQVFVHRQIGDTKTARAEYAPNAVFAVKQSTSRQAKRIVFHRLILGRVITSATITLKATMKAVVRHEPCSLGKAKNRHAIESQHPS
jgi:hypothetical protein